MQTFLVLVDVDAKQTRFNYNEVGLGFKVVKMPEKGVGSINNIMR